jgi:hypothetical protein
VLAAVHGLDIVLQCAPFTEFHLGIRRQGVPRCRV